MDFERDVKEGKAITLDTYRAIIKRLYKELRTIALDQLGFRFADATTPNYDCVFNGSTPRKDFFELTGAFQGAIAMYVTAFVSLTVGCCGQRPEVFCHLTFSCFEELVMEGDDATKVHISHLEKVARSRAPLWLDTNLTRIVRHVLGFWSACVHGLTLATMVEDHPDCLVLPHLINSARDGVRKDRTIRATLLDPASVPACTMSTSAYTRQLRHCFCDIEGLGNFEYGVPVQGQHLRDFLWSHVNGGAPCYPHPCAR